MIAQSNGFPDTVKRAAFEDIIGKYFAFDPFLQPDRKGHVVEHYSDPSSTVNLKEDLGVYSIPPAYTGLEDSIREQIPDYNESPPIYISGHIENEAFNYKQFSNFQDEEFPQHSESPASKNVKKNHFQELSSIANLPKYVTGINEENADSIFNGHHDIIATRDPVYRGQLQGRKPLSPLLIRKLPQFSSRSTKRDPELPTFRYYFEEPNMYYTE